MKSNSRRGFLKMVSMAAAASVLPKPDMKMYLPSATSNADMRIGLDVERMRIMSDGSVSLGTIAPNTKLDIVNTK